MSSTWVLVSNSSCARLFQVEKNGSLLEIKSFSHPESRMHERDLTSDRPGRSYESATTARHALEPETSQKTLEFVSFAKELSSYLQQAQKEGKFQRLYLAATPHFLGLLRQEISNEIVHTLRETIDKDLTQLSALEIRKQLPY